MSLNDIVHIVKFVLIPAENMKSNAFGLIQILPSSLNNDDIEILAFRYLFED